MFESSQKDESGAKQDDCPKGGHEAAACFTTLRKQSLFAFHQRSVSATTTYISHMWVYFFAQFAPGSCEFPVKALIWERRIFHVFTFRSLCSDLFTAF